MTTGRFLIIVLSTRCRFCWRKKEVVVGEPSGLRQAAIEWLHHRTADGQEVLTREDIADFAYLGEPFRLIEAQKGIWLPGGFDYALSIRTAFTRIGDTPPYEDEIGSDGLIKYAWEKGGRDSRGNVALRNAMHDRVPVIWFIGVGMSPARYQVVAPVYVVGEEPALQRFVIVPADLESMNALERTATPIEEQMRVYQQQVTRRRVHQPVFRSQVLAAYEDRCAVCSLRHRSLLDAAHIVPDSHEQGIASVVNGMSLCKIHHAAFDSNFLGVRPDLVVEIRRDLLDEVDGPMLKHGLQELHGRKLMAVPSATAARPRPDLLEIKYEMFRRATTADVA